MADLPPTQKEIAAAAGVSRSTVTRALRNDPQISRAERERIQGIAQEMGYRPNPMIDALMAQVRSRKPGHYQATLGWVAQGWRESDWRKQAERPVLFEAARSRAEALGYDLQVFFPRDAGQSPEALLHMLDARGIRGLLLESSAPGTNYDDWDPTGFVAVTVGFRLGSPPLHFVANDLFAGMWSMLHTLHSRGLKRPGLLIDTAHSQFSQFRITGGFHAFLEDRLPRESWCPVWRSGQNSRLPAWLEKHQPDVLIMDHEGLLEQLGTDFPSDCMIPIIALQTTLTGKLEGMVLDPKRLGSAAVDLLTAHLIRNETGIPETQKGVMLEAEWRIPR